MLGGGEADKLVEGTGGLRDLLALAVFSDGSAVAVGVPMLSLTLAHVPLPSLIKLQHMEESFSVAKRIG